MTPLELVLSKLDRKRRSGGRWMARCPAHDDKNPSLSIAEGGDGRVLVTCHAGCTLESIVAAMGIKVSDLFPERPAPTRSVKDQDDSLDLEDAHAEALRRVHASEGRAFIQVATYKYDVEGGGALRVTRYEDGEGNKTIRQMSSVADGRWVLKGASAPVLPYRHARLKEAPRVWVVEGEVCVHTLEELGLTATTSAGGSNAARKTNWTPLRGANLVLLPDNDDPGRQYVTDVLELSAPKVAVVLDLPGLDAGDDVVDFVAQLRAQGADDDSIREHLERLANAQEPESRASSGSRRQPFPLEVLPQEVIDLVEAVSESRCVDVSAPAALALAAMGSAIGFKRVAFDDYADWEEIAVIWLGMISRSGTRKTVLIDDLFQPHHARQRRLMEEYEAALADHVQQLESWKKDQKKKDLEGKPPPKAPVLEHTYTSDTTPEGLVEILKSDGQGIVVLTDELTTFLAGLGRYTGKADMERAFYLALFRGTQFKKDRKSSGPVLIQRAAASIVGGIQPSILERCFDPQAFGSGMVARFLLVEPRSRVKQYARGPSADIKQAYRKLVDGLFGLPVEPYMMANGDIGSRPQRVLLDSGARELLRSFVPKWSAASITSDPDIEAAMSKLEAYVLRFALILRCCREAAGEAGPDDPLTRADLRDGIRLAVWFKGEAESVYAALQGHRERQLGDALLVRAEVIRVQFGGAVTARDWLKLNTRRSREEAKAELDELVEAGLARWRDRPPGPKGGRPTEECALVDPPGNGRDEPPVPGFGLRVHEGQAGDPELRAPRDPQGRGQGGAVWPRVHPATRNPKPGAVPGSSSSQAPLERTGWWSWCWTCSTVRRSPARGRERSFPS